MQGRGGRGEYDIWPSILSLPLSQILCVNAFRSAVEKRQQMIYEVKISRRSALRQARANGFPMGLSGGVIEQRAVLGSAFEFPCVTFISAFAFRDPSPSLSSLLTGWSFHTWQ